MRPSDAELGSYSRLFAFGCSFTNWLWPTWADVLSWEMPGAEYHNHGLRGAGNVFIASRLSECDHRYGFGPGDLVAVMWTTSCREDRYVRSQGGWNGTGNIYNDCDIYPLSWVMENVDPFGHLLRDTCLIDLAGRAMSRSGAHIVQMRVADPWFMQEPGDPDVAALVERYRGCDAAVGPGFIDSHLGGNLAVTHRYRLRSGGMTDDLHPGTMAHRGYLERVGFALGDASARRAADAERRMGLCGTQDDLIAEFGLGDQIDRGREWLK